MPKGYPKNNSTERNILHQLKIVRGHLDKVIRMTEEDAYCVDVVHQSLAIQAALKKIDQRILKRHMESCVADAIRKGEDQKVITEIMSVLEKI